MKKCRDCNLVKPFEDYHLDVAKTDMRRSYCKDCSIIRSRNNYQKNKERVLAKSKKYRKENPERVARNHRNYAEKNKEKLRIYLSQYHAENKQRLKNVLETNHYKRLSYLITAAKNRAKIKNLEFNLCIDNVFPKLLYQNFRCAVLNVEFDLRFSSDFSVSPFGISIDKIDSKKGYTADNVQLVCNIVNMAKSQFPIEIFDQMCRARVEVLNASKV